MNKLLIYISLGMAALTAMTFALTYITGAA